MFYKLKRDGWGEQISRRDLGANEELKFLDWSNDKFQLFCCLTGCDFVTKVAGMGMGIKTAFKLVSPCESVLEIFLALRHNYPNEDDYVKELIQGWMIFNYQTVNILNKSVVQL